MKISGPAVSCLALIASMAEADVENIEPVIQAEVVQVPAEEPSAKIRLVASDPEGTGMGFVDRLSEEERKAAGLGKLSEEQRSALDAHVAKEMRLARQGDVVGFSGTFISRRSDAEKNAAGLGLLSTGEKYQLDRLVSRSLASRPAQPPLVNTRPPAEVELGPVKSDWETHGFVQFEFGWGSGDREYKAATVGVAQVNPKTGTAITFEYTVSEGAGPWYCRDYSQGWRAGQSRLWRY